jgi:PTS system nitrogen regulatory IIA component
MRLLDVVDPDCCAVNVAASDKSASLREVARAALNSSALAGVGEDKLFAALREREALGSTGFGKGIAIPHCRVAGAGGFVVGAVTLQDAIPFEAVDDQPVRLLVFIIAPEGESRDHIRMLSAISQALMIPGTIEEMLAAHSPEALVESFLRHTEAEPESKDQEHKSLFQIFVQDEDVFREILQLLASVEGRPVAVFDGQLPEAYLVRMPLFAGFFKDDESAACKLVYTVVDRRRKNETLLRIESVTGPLSDRRDVLVTIQDLAYAAGGFGE